MDIDKNMSFKEFLSAYKGVKTHYDADLYSEGLYYKYLVKWYSVLGSDRMKVVFYDDIIKKPDCVVRELFNWLNVDDVTGSIDFGVRKNISYSPKCKILHAILYKTYFLNERVFRNSRIVDMLKKYYVMLNADTDDRNIYYDSMTLDSIRSYYHDDNVKLKKLLEDNGVGGLPIWLQ